MHKINAFWPGGRGFDWRVSDGRPTRTSLTARMGTGGISSEFTEPGNRACDVIMKFILYH